MNIHRPFSFFLITSVVWSVSLYPMKKDTQVVLYNGKPQIARDGISYYPHHIPSLACLTLQHVSKQYPDEFPTHVKEKLQFIFGKEGLLRLLTKDSSADILYTVFNTMAPLASQDRISCIPSTLTLGMLPVKHQVELLENINPVVWWHGRVIKESEPVSVSEKVVLNFDGQFIIPGERVSIDVSKEDYISIIGDNRYFLQKRIDVPRSPNPALHRCAGRLFTRNKEVFKDADKYCVIYFDVSDGSGTPALVVEIKKDSKATLAAYKDSSLSGILSVLRCPKSEEV